MFCCILQNAELQAFTCSDACGVDAGDSASIERAGQRAPAANRRRQNCVRGRAVGIEGPDGSVQCVRVLITSRPNASHHLHESSVHVSRLTLAALLASDCMKPHNNSVSLDGPVPAPNHSEATRIDNKTQRGTAQHDHASDPNDNEFLQYGALGPCLGDEAVLGRPLHDQVEDVCVAWGEEHAQLCLGDDVPNPEGSNGTSSLVARHLTRHSPGHAREGQQGEGPAWPRPHCGEMLTSTTDSRMATVQDRHSLADCAAAASGFAINPTR